MRRRDEKKKRKRGNGYLFPSPPRSAGDEFSPWNRSRNAQIAHCTFLYGRTPRLLLRREGQEELLREWISGGRFWDRIQWTSHLET